MPDPSPEQLPLALLFPDVSGFTGGGRLPRAGGGPAFIAVVIHIL